MWESAAAALVLLFEPARLAALFAGLLAGMLFGMLPGLGGVATVSILLPFIYAFDTLTAMAMLLGAISVVYTSDTITSVMVGAPGSPASAPTAIEGYALAKQGKAAEALTVGFLSSCVGGIVGAIVLTFAIPVAGPLVLFLGTPELFMFAVVGLYYASSLIGGNLAKGLLAGCLGVALGMIGPAPAAAEFRFTFGQAYLLDGLSLVIVALGMFGIVEALAMLAQGGGIAGSRTVLVEWRSGVVAFWRNRWLVLRGALIGVLGGMVPAVGANASTWVAYAHAVRTTKDKSRFGKGEIRGVACAESANNSTIISDLVPTMLFSVPGGPAAAVFLGALYGFGFYPGPLFVRDHPDVMFLVVWSVALASVAGTLLCFAISPFIARLTQIRFALIAAPLILVMVLGSFQATNTIGDMIVLCALGMLGWMMKQGGWPRAPVLVGFVLAGPMEQYFWLTEQLHGWAFLARPGVIAVGLLIVLPMLWRLAKFIRATQAERAQARAQRAGFGDETAPAAADDVEGRAIATGRVSTVLSMVLLVAFAVGFVQALGLARDARLLPMIAIAPGLALALLVTVTDLMRRHWLRPLLGSQSGRIVASELRQFLYLIAFAVGIFLVGFKVAAAFYLLWVLLSAARMRLHWAAAYAAVVVAAAWTLADVMRLSLPPGLLTGLT